MVSSADQKYTDNSNESNLHHGQSDGPPSRLFLPSNTRIAFQHTESMNSASVVPNDDRNERGIPVYDIYRQVMLVQSVNSLPSPSRLFMKVNEGDGYPSKSQSSFNGIES